MAEAEDMQRELHDISWMRDVCREQACLEARPRSGSHAWCWRRRRELQGTTAEMEDRQREAQGVLQEAAQAAEAARAKVSPLEQMLTAVGRQSRKASHGA